MENIRIKDIKQTDLNPRKEFKKGSIQELANSIKKQGLLQAVVVRKVGKAYELIIGSRRLQAMEILKESEIRAEVVSADDDKARSMMIVENMQREDVHPMDEAEAIGQLYKMQKTYENVGAALGKTTAHVAKRIKLNDLIQEGKTKFRKGQMSLDHALVLCVVPNDVQKQAIIEGWRYNIPGLQNVKRMISDLQANLSEVAFDLQDEKLNPEAGTCIGCEHNTSTNQTLFADVLDDARCQNYKCFELKLKAYIKRIKDGLNAKNQKYVEVSGNYQSSKYPARHNYHDLTRHGYGPNKPKDCPDIIKGLIMEEGHDHKVGNVIRICMKPGCSVHSHGGRSSSSVKPGIPENELKHEAAARKLKKRWHRENAQDRKTARQSVSDQIKARRTTLRPVELGILAKDILRHYDVSAADVAAQLGIIDKKDINRYSDWDRHSALYNKVIAFVTDERIFARLMRIAMTGQYMYDEAEYDKEKHNPITGKNELVLMADANDINLKSTYKRLQEERAVIRTDQEIQVGRMATKYKTSEKKAKELVNTDDYYDEITAGQRELIRMAKKGLKSFQIFVKEMVEVHNVEPGDLLKLAKMLNLDTIPKDVTNNLLAEPVWKRVQALKADAKQAKKPAVKKGGKK